MLLKTLENSVLENFTYYHIVIFEDANKPGKDYPNAYKTERGATKAAENLIKSGKYNTIVLRREEVIKQVPHKTYFSINSAIKTYQKQEAAQ
jgi:hypothetical protein